MQIPTAWLGTRGRLGGWGDKSSGRGLSAEQTLLTRCLSSCPSPAYPSWYPRMKPAQSVQLRDSVGADTGKCWAWHGQDSVSALGEDHQGKTCIFTGALQSGSPRASTQEVLQTCLKYLFLDPRVKWRNCTSGSLRSFLWHSGILWLVPHRMGESESTFVQ